jgi:hypothetical protein
MDWQLSPGAEIAQLEATMAYADQGSGASRLLVFATDKPVPGAAVNATPQVEFVLAKPSGRITGGVWVLAAAQPGGSMVMATGIPRWARWLTAGGAWVADGDVTDADHGGAIRLAGGATPEGDTSPMLYAGGLAVLVSSELT